MHQGLDDAFPHPILMENNIPLMKITFQTVLDFQRDVEGIKRQNRISSNSQSHLSC